MLSQNLTENGKRFKFGYDPVSGEYGYYKEEGGADTFAPFRKGGAAICFGTGCPTYQTAGNPCWMYILTPNEYLRKNPTTYEAATLEDSEYFAASITQDSQAVSTRFNATVKKAGYYLAFAYGYGMTEPAGNNVISYKNVGDTLSLFCGDPRSSYVGYAVSVLYVYLGEENPFA